VFEPVIAVIAFALIVLVIAGVAIAAAVRRRMSRGADANSIADTRHPDGWRAGDDGRVTDGLPAERSNRDSRRAVNE
jgi:hypothetical protein